MSHYGIPVDRSCGSYRPGHQVHWIHAKKASAKDQPLIAVSITFRGYGWVDIQGRDPSLTLWTHEATRLRQVWDTCGRAVWKPGWHMLSLPGPSGSCFKMATWDRRTPCVEKSAPPFDLRTTVERVLWEARTYGGYTVPMSSMSPGEAAKVVEELRRDDLRVTMWSGDVGDSVPENETSLVANAGKSFQPQQIVLIHANLPTVTHCYPQLIDLVRSRNLQTVTLNDVFA